MRKRISFLLAVVLLLNLGGPRHVFPFGPAAHPARAVPSETESGDENPIPDETAPAELEPEPEAETTPAPEPEPESEPTPEPEPEPEQERAAEAVPQSDFVPEPHQRVVYNYSQLKQALEDSTTTEVYFGGDIVMTDGIHINPGKIHLRVSGINPGDPLQTVHTLTDRNTMVQSDTIYLGATDTAMRTVTVSDLNIIGKNYFGPFSVFLGVNMTQIVITYERVTYDGPQIGYNINSTIRVVDSTFNLHGGNGTSPSSEFAEAKHLVFEGDNRITTATTVFSVFWIVYGGTFRVENDSSLRLTATGAAPTFAIFYANSSSVDVSVGKNALLDIETSCAMSRPDGKISGLTVEEDGTFSLRSTSTRPLHALHMTGPISVARGGTFRIAGTGNASYDLLRQEDGDITVQQGATFHLTASGQYTSLLHLYGQALVCNDPASVVFAGPGRTILSSSTAATVLSSHAQQYAYWNAHVQSGLDTVPPHRWEKRDPDRFALSATISNTASVGFTNMSSNYTPADPPGVAPSAALLNLSSMRVFAFGYLPLHVVPPLPGQHAITGTTAPGAEVRAVRINGETKTVLAVGVADGQGSFRLHPDLSLTSGETIQVESAWNYLAAQAEVAVLPAGGLTLSVPASIPFRTTPLTGVPMVVERVEPDWSLTVSDTRVDSPGWQLYARLDRPLTPFSPALPVIHGAVSFVMPDGTVIPLTDDAEVLIAHHTPPVGAPDFTVGWPADRGLLLVIPTAAVYADMPYTATISWILEDTP